MSTSNARRPSAIDPTDAERALSRDGFVLLPDLCESDWVDHILDVSLRRAGEVREALDGRKIGIGSAAGFDEIVQRSPGRWDVPIAPRRFGVDDRELPWWPIVLRVLGDRAVPSFSGVVFSDPMTPAQQWHIDSPHVSSEHLPAHALNVLVALHDVPLSMGPTELARGSQRLTNHLANPSLVMEELVYQHQGTSPETLVAGTGKAPPEGHAEASTKGSCILFDDRILHRGLANRSERVRNVAYFCYRRADYAENTHFEAQRSVFDPDPSG